MEEIRISLTEQDFKELVNGEIVNTRLVDGRRVKITLQDIGFKQMEEAVADAKHSYSIARYPDDV